MFSRNFYQAVNSQSDFCNEEFFFQYVPRDEARNKNLENNPDYGKAEDFKACVDYFKYKNILRESFLTVVGEN